ncbi:hypothetical protein APHAL10511_005775 [Amanita phalloides]|nr:hypothetical protein APHAL10511_005775 [Amanita phalloides]
MPYFFAGKFSHETTSYANNELWTVLLPRSLRVGDPAIVVCQWTKTAAGVQKHNDIWNGEITKLTRDSSGITIEIFKDDSNLYYWFQGTINAQEDKISLTMKNPRNEYCGYANADIVYKVVWE